MRSSSSDRPDPRKLIGKSRKSYIRRRSPDGSPVRRSRYYGVQYQKKNGTADIRKTQEAKGKSGAERIDWDRIRRKSSWQLERNPKCIEAVEMMLKNSMSQRHSNRTDDCGMQLNSKQQACVRNWIRRCPEEPRGRRHCAFVSHRLHPGEQRYSPHWLLWTLRHTAGHG